MNINVIGYRKIYYFLSGILVLTSITSLFFWGLKFGIDFTGGSLIEVNYLDARPSTEDLSLKIESAGFGTVSAAPAGESGVIFRLKEIDETEHQRVLGILKEGRNVEEKRFESIGPTIGRELKTKAIEAVILVLFAIVIYIAWAFRKVSRPVVSWKYGVVAIIALLHDTIIPIGVFSILGKFYGIEIDTFFVTAILTVLGFSVHDTIVVFDRIRENIKKATHERFEDVVNKSINQTFVRSINTSMTVLFVLLSIYIFGGSSIANFALTLLIGIIAGTYSSIFIASPLLVTWELLTKRRV